MNASLRKLVYFLVALGALALLCVPLFGAEWYVGPTATGDGTGSGTGNLMAWSSAPVRGDTWRLVPGSYGGKDFTTPESGTAFINILADSGGVSFTQKCHVTTSNWKFDGLTGTGTNASSYGFTISMDTVTSGWWFNNTYTIVAFFVGPESSSWSTISNVTFAHFCCTGPNNDSSRMFVYNNGLNSCHDITIQSNLLDGISHYFQSVAPSGKSNFASPNTDYYNLLFDHNICLNSGCVEGSLNCHGNGVSITYGGWDHLTVSFNLFRGMRGLASSFVSANESVIGYANVFGNVFDGCTPANGDVADTSGGDKYLHDIVVAYNTFVNCNNILTPSRYTKWINPGSATTGNNLLVNNLLFASGTDVLNASDDYNYFSDSVSGPPTEASGQVATGSPFVAGTYYLATNTVAGTNLPVPFNVDGNGMARTTRSRGAYEYASAGTNSPATNASSVVYYVSPTGTGLSTASNAPGSLAYTVPRAASNTVFLLAGNYTYASSILVSNGPLTITCSPKWSAVVSYVPDHPFQVCGPASGVTIDGLAFKTNQYDVLMYQQDGFGLVSNCTFANCWCIGTGGAAGGSSSASGVEIIGNGMAVSNCLLEWNGLNSTAGQNHGIYGGGQNCSYVGNVCRYNKGAGIIVNGHKDSGGVYDNNIYASGNLCYSNLSGGSQLAVKCDAPGNAGTIYARSNTFLDSYSYAVIDYGGATLRLTNNIIVSSGSGVNDLGGSGITSGLNALTNNTSLFVNASNGLYWPKSAGITAGAYSYSAVAAADTRALDPSPIGGADYWAGFGQPVGSGDVINTNSGVWLNISSWPF